MTLQFLQMETKTSINREQCFCTRAKKTRKHLSGNAHLGATSHQNLSRQSHQRHENLHNDALWQPSGVRLVFARQLLARRKENARRRKYGRNCRNKLGRQRTIGWGLKDASLQNRRRKSIDCTEKKNVFAHNSHEQVCKAICRNSKVEKRWNSTAM